MKKILLAFIFVGILTSGFTYATFNLQVGKDNSLPDLNWERTLYINEYDSFTINFVQQTSDGGQIATGVACKDGPESFFGFVWDVLLVKINLNGYVEWFQTYETPENERGLCVRQTDDGGYIIASYKFFNYIEGYAWLLKTDSDGNIEWDKTYDSWIGAWDIARSVCQNPDGGYLIAGCLTNENVDSSFADWSSPTDAYIIKTDSAGEEIWRKAFYEDQGFFGSTFNSIEKTSDGGYIITGTGYHFENDPITYYPINIGSILLLKLDLDGDELWRRTYFPSGEEYSYPIEGFDWISLSAHSVKQTFAGGYIISGENSSRESGANTLSKNRALLITTDEDGNIQWNRTFSEEERARILITLNSRYILRAPELVSSSIFLE